MPQLLIVLTGADAWTLDDGDTHPTGFWAEELLAPLRVFRDAGLDVTFATPGGVRPTVDEASLSADAAGGEERAAELREELNALGDEFYSPMPLEDVSPADYSAVFIPGGHGPMEDLAVSPELGALLVEMLDDDKVVAAVCHGPAGLLSATRPDGTWAFAGRDLTGFSNAEETQAGLADRASWLLENRLREGGANVQNGPDWQPFSIVDDNIVTGQNPASSTEVAEKTVERIDARAHWIHVVPHDGGWTFKHEHGQPGGRFETQKQAIEAAKEHAHEHGDWEMVVHGRNGRIRDVLAIH